MDIPTDRTTAEYWDVVLWDAIADWVLNEMERGRIEPPREHDEPSQNGSNK